MCAIKIVASGLLCCAFTQALAFETLTCISDNTFHRCDLANAEQRDIRIKNVKAGNCDTDNAWGVDTAGIWVNNGCGAVFEYTDSTSSNTNTSVTIDPGYVAPYYGPGFYYGAGYYQYNNWNNNDYCNNHTCNHTQQHNNQDHVDRENVGEHDEFHEEDFHGGGYHGGGGGRR